MASIHIGLSGYSYKPWQGPERFYPLDLKQSDFLGYYATRYDTVELDGLWYRLPTLAAVERWIGQTPDHFVFSPKAHREITHFKRLRAEAIPFLQTMVERLAPLAETRRLGPILLQLPPNLKRNDDRLAEFLSSLSRSHRWAMEFRHDSWHDPAVEELLRHARIAWAAVETDDHHAEHRDTADFVYARLRRSQYKDGDLEEWGKYLLEARKNGKDCFVYCKHEDEGSPWVWADRLLQITGTIPLPGGDHR
ncbi:MAG: DUF72 domain-containing protein [Nitrospiraceae bacterium]